MSAKLAAEALYNFDCDLKSKIDTINEESYWWIREGGRERGLEIIQDVMNTYTLSMVAHASKQSEKAVLAALYKNYLHGGTACVVSGEINKLFE